MLDLEALRRVRTIATHENCPDGVASALVLLAALPEARVVFLQYGSAAHRDLPAEPGMLFCDVTPPRERVREFVEAGAFCLDHHKRQEDVVRAFGERGVFADEALDPGVSGAVLAFREVFSLVYRSDSEAELARLVGIRDTWQKGHPEFARASQVSEVLRFVSFETLRAMEVRHVLGLAHDIGPVLLDHKLATAHDVAVRAVRLVAGDLRIAVVPSVTLTSDASELVQDADVTAGFAYCADPGGTGLRLQWSLRSRTGVDVSAIARSHGGGGHTAAAGFSVPDDGRSPYLRVAELLTAR